MLTLTPPIPDESVTAVMLELLDLKPTDRLMEIGTGTGSQTAVWQKHVAEVHSVELERRYKVHHNLGPHVYLSFGDGVKGIPEMAPYDAIVVTCGTSEIPEAWGDQLKEGGKLVVPVGTAGAQRLTLYRKVKGFLKPERIAAYVRFVMMEKDSEPWQPITSIA